MFMYEIGPYPVLQAFLRFEFVEKTETIANKRNEGRRGRRSGVSSLPLPLPLGLFILAPFSRQLRPGSDAPPLMY